MLWPAVNFREALSTAVLAAVCLLPGCGSDPPPPAELTPAAAAARIEQRWANDELNHFWIEFHSDTLIECGVEHGLWKLSDVTDDNGHLWSTIYRLTPKGEAAVTSIHLQQSGRGHQMLLKGPYTVEIHSITEGAQPDTRYVAFRWDMDWDKAPQGLKACVPRFELSGTRTAVFELHGTQWRFTGYLHSEQAPATQPGSTPVFDKFR
jgi:hypothetical protein